MAGLMVSGARSSHESSAGHLDSEITLDLVLMLSLTGAFGVGGAGGGGGVSGISGRRSGTASSMRWMRVVRCSAVHRL